VTKTFGVFFGFAVPIAVQLQNAHVKFHKVVYRHYSGKQENVKTVVSQIYSGQCVPNVIKIDWAL